MNNSGDNGMTTAEIAAYNNWINLDVALVETEENQEPYFDGVGRCVIPTSWPTTSDLETNWPSDSPVFKHLGRSMMDCYTNKASGHPLPLDSEDPFYAASVNIDLQATEDDCGGRSVLGCYFEWENLLYVIDANIWAWVDEDNPYDDWRSMIIGHELWHAVDRSHWHEY